MPGCKEASLVACEALAGVGEGATQALGTSTCSRLVVKAASAPVLPLTHGRRLG